MTVRARVLIGEHRAMQDQAEECQPRAGMEGGVYPFFTSSSAHGWQSVQIHVADKRPALFFAKISNIFRRVSDGPVSRTVSRPAEAMASLPNRHVGLKSAPTRVGSDFMNEDSDLLAGFNADFEELGEEAVRRRLGEFSAGKREMASNWLDLKQREAALARARAAQRAENRANLAIAISIIAIVASFIGR